MATMEELEARVAELQAKLDQSEERVRQIDSQVDSRTDVALSPDQRGRKTIRYYSRWAAGAGLLSPPIVDIFALAAVQVTMVKRLANIYNKDFDEESGRALTTALVGALTPAAVGQGAAKLFVRAFGLGMIGSLTSAATVPALNYGSTTTVGWFFQEHFKKAGNERVNLNDLATMLREKYQTAA
jgi:uncharacterized protein (DUF697 family)